MPRFENIERVQSYDSPVKLRRSKFSVRDVRGRGWNKRAKRERKREREAYLSRVLKEKGEKDRLFHGVNDGVRMSVTGGRIAYQERRNGS